MSTYEYSWDPYTGQVTHEWWVLESWIWVICGKKPIRIWVRLFEFKKLMSMGALMFSFSTIMETKMLLHIFKILTMDHANNN